MSEHAPDCDTRTAVAPRAVCLADSVVSLHGPIRLAVVSTAANIRNAFAAVAQLRAQTATDPALAQAVVAVKQLQAQRFSGTYADILRTPDYGYAPAAQFFLTELYSAKDYAERDAQFARIAGAIEKLFPAKVGALAESLAQLHALTEALDHAMGAAWLAASPSTKSFHLAGTMLTVQAKTYATAWRTVGRTEDRHAQLRIVLGIGAELERLTRTVGLRSLLRLMRSPSRAAGLEALQAFLEKGFDTFAALAQVAGGVQGFLNVIGQRESALIDVLFSADVVACETKLQHTLGQAP